MSLAQRRAFPRRKSERKPTQLRSGRLACEPLEDRRMLTLLGIAPVLLPSMTYDSTGHIEYTAANDTFDLTATPLTFRNTSGPPHNFSGAGDLSVHILVDNSGNLIGGTPGDDFQIDGTVSPTGLAADNVSGVLLTGEVLGFGFLEAGTTDQYDMRFRVTGGLLASYFAGDDIGMTVGSENSTFNDDFSLDFQGGAKGNVGNIPSLPGTIIVDKVTNPAGDPTSFTFNTTGSNYNGFNLTDTDAPNSQQVTPGSYSVSELVPSDWDLTDLTVDDPTGDSTVSLDSATIEVASGETVHVTFTDTKRGHIVVDKVTNPAGDPTSFSFSTTARATVASTSPTPIRRTTSCSCRATIASPSSCRATGT